MRKPIQIKKRLVYFSVEIQFYFLSTVIFDSINKNHRVFRRRVTDGYSPVEQDRETEC